MRIDRLAPIVALFAALAGCGKSEEQIRADERAKVTAELAGQAKAAPAVPTAAEVPPAATATTPPAPAAPQARPWPGRYDLASEGSPDGYVTIAAIKGSPGRYKVEVGIGANMCMGSTGGTAIENGPGALAFTANRDPEAPGDDPLCKISFQRKSNSAAIDVVEDYESCSPWHGAACSFNGEMKLAR